MIGRVYMKLTRVSNFTLVVPPLPATGQVAGAGVTVVQLGARLAVGCEVNRALMQVLSTLKT